MQYADIVIPWCTVNTHNKQCLHPDVEKFIANNKLHLIMECLHFFLPLFSFVSLLLVSVVFITCLFQNCSLVFRVRLAKLFGHAHKNESPQRFSLLSNSSTELMGNG